MFHSYFCVTETIYFPENGCMQLSWLKIFNAHQWQSEQSWIAKCCGSVQASMGYSLCTEQQRFCLLGTFKNWMQTGSQQFACSRKRNNCEKWQAKDAVWGLTVDWHG